MSVATTPYQTHLTIGGHPITWRESLGNAFGFASAVGGLRRRVWAWPAGIVGGPAVVPRWATHAERTAYLVASVAALLVVQRVFSVIGAGFPAPRWYYWCDAWIFVGSMLATYAMARGWNDFWLAWIAVDLVGVPLLWHSQCYPTAVLSVVYAGLLVWGFVVWLRASRTESVPPRERMDA